MNAFACLTPFFANTMPQVVMYISCFVGPHCTSSLSSHQTFIQQKHIYISRDPAQPNLLGESTSLSLSRYHSLRMFHVIVWLFSSLPRLPQSPHTHPLPPFCSNPLLLKASFVFPFVFIIHSFSNCSKKEARQRTAQTVFCGCGWDETSLLNLCNKQYM